ncbi:hypothetical protein L2E82_31838 [Cichorium intybus]|uniref:Uncharacterized protein n=1 Tax=Cichorium intybus TaxID=13427 RepID=A0ACB9BEM9_CICIN|nr:hypothetical protein L2E82_31838 [Cichorium intybus]
MASSNVDSIKRHLDFSHFQILKNMEASQSRLHKRFKVDFCCIYYRTTDNQSVEEPQPSRYFVLNVGDLEEWHQNPEYFHHEQDAVLWSEKLRPCAEGLYILLGPVVVSILQEAMSGCPPSVTDMISGKVSVRVI